MNPEVEDTPVERDESLSLNVLLLAEDFYPKKSGGAFIDWNVAKYLVDNGDRVTAVTSRNGDTPSAESIDGIDIRRPIPSHGSEIHPNSAVGILWRVIFTVFVAPYLFYLVWSRDFDLVYSTNHLYHPIASLLSKVFRLSHVSFVGYSPSIRENVTLLSPLVVLERLNFRLFMGDRVICQSPSVYELLSELSKAEVERVDGTVDADAVATAMASTEPSDSPIDMDSEYQLIFVGRLEAIKNPDELPQIIAQLPSEYSLTIIGDGPFRDSVETAIDETGMGDRITLAGMFPHEQTLRAIHESDLLILPSKADAYPAVVFEALSLNTPVLATPVGALPSTDHPNLTIAPLDEFNDLIIKMDTNPNRGINDETLSKFSVQRLAQEVRNHMLKAVNYSRS